MPFSGSSVEATERRLFIANSRQNWQKHGAVRRWKQCHNKLKVFKKKYKEVIDGCITAVVV